MKSKACLSAYKGILRTQGYSYSYQWYRGGATAIFQYPQ